ncbi:ADP-ribosylation factor-binding protein GGA1 isoform X1 [Polypterus senegalus]|uniref:ADP-ribosylation factor-binding protein GGA1 isoform X1 n=1 Tax=Polypterus senegalus TaxID=55291 RepID=UPI0019628907|nr:ADP-ribosylation factor-binding protein GGA1 isoform X1 [Polypterus senegalus]
MAAPPEDESLESRISPWTDRATNPLNKELDWDSIRVFCEQLNKELEGPQLATRLLAHKIQSPQEWEALQALTVLETCMKNCGKRFHNEVGKFRFLNELIKVVSPKYLGTRAPEKVKLKILELMYSWTVGLPDETKIADAYQMLKKQGIVKQDPILPDDKPLPPPPPRPKNAIFEDEEKSKMLSRLLNSTHPEDLRAANRLIKEMVQEDQKRMEKISKRVAAIKEVNNNVKILTEMLNNYNKETSTESNEEVIKELYQRCDKMRPTLFRLASDTEDNDEALAEILQANDNLTQVINMYKQVVKGEEVNGESSTTPRMSGSNSALLDLTGLDTSVSSATPFYPAVPTLSQGHIAPPTEMSLSFLDDELMSLGLNETNPTPSITTQTLDSSGWHSFQSSDGMDPTTPAAPAVVLKPAVPSNPPSTQGPSVSSKALDDLDLLGKTLLQQSLPPEAMQVKWDKQQQHAKPTLRDLQHKSNPLGTVAGPAVSNSSAPVSTSPSKPSFSGMTSSTVEQTVSQLGSLASAAQQEELSLANVNVPLESIKPSSILPVTVFDSNSFRVLFHFAQDPPPGRPDVLVVVISMISTAPLPMHNIVFQSAVPKTMKVKLQPPSGTELPAFNPIIPPTAITQVLLLANPHKEKVRLRYKLTFTMGDETYDEMGDVDQFPTPESWGCL